MEMEVVKVAAVLCQGRLDFSMKYGYDVAVSGDVLQLMCKFPLSNYNNIQKEEKKERKRRKNSSKAEKDEQRIIVTAVTLISTEVKSQQSTLNSLIM